MSEPATPNHNLLLLLLKTEDQETDYLNHGMAWPYVIMPPKPRRDERGLQAMAASRVSPDHKKRSILKGIY